MSTQILSARRIAGFGTLETNSKYRLRDLATGDLLIGEASRRSFNLPDSICRDDDSSCEPWVRCGRALQHTNFQWITTSVSLVTHMPSQDREVGRGEAAREKPHDVIDPNVPSAHPAQRTRYVAWPSIRHPLLRSASMMAELQVSAGKDDVY
jgi:hypothetical protein